VVGGVKVAELWKNPIWFSTDRQCVNINQSCQTTEGIMLDLTAGAQVFAVATFGGVANEALHWWGLRYNPELPVFAKHWLYWVISIIFAVMGGALAFIQLGSSANALVAFQLGIAAPHILKKLAAGDGGQPGAMGRGADWKRFLKG
jgi:hypothetical protein